MPFGWNSIILKFSGSVEGISIGNFSISGVGNDEPIEISGITRGSSQNDLVVIFNRQINPGNRAILKYIPENKEICIGYLPGDVNGDGVRSPNDMLAFIDALNGQKEFPIYSTDIDRSGIFTSADNLAFIDIGNGIYGDWNGKSLPPCKCTDDLQCSSGYVCNEGTCTELSGSPIFIDGEGLLVNLIRILKVI